MTPPESHIARSSFEALAESAPDAILTIDEHSTIISANPATKRIFGYDPTEIIGEKLTILMPERLRSLHEQGIARYLRTGRRNIPWTGIELSAARKDGCELPVEISFGEFLDENGRRVFSGFVRDISERVRQQKELQKARGEAERALSDLARLGRIIDAPLGRMTFDAMTQDLLARLREEIEADSTALLLLDETRTELVMRHSLGLPDDVRTLRVPVGTGISGQVASTGEPMIVQDSREAGVTSVALGPKAISVAAVPLRSDDEIVGVLAVGSSAVNRFDEVDLRFLKLVAERTAGVFARSRLYMELERRQAEAEAAIKVRDDVLSIVSHDLRNPVSTIAMSASMLSDADMQLTEEKRRQQLDVIARSAERMNRLIQDLLDIARIEGQRLTMQCRCEHPRSLMTDAYDAFRAIAEEKSVVLEQEIDPALKPVHVDRDRVLQLLSNYLDNALKFTPTGGRIRIAARATGDGGACFGVTDSGSGIRKEDIPHVFSRFWQAKRTAHLGSGLGLAIAYGIAQAHRGRVWVESTPGVETTFYFEVPHSKECG